MHTYSKTHLILEGIFTIVWIKFQELANASILLYCSNVYTLYMRKSETIRNRLLVINWLKKIWKHRSINWLFRERGYLDSAYYVGSLAGSFMVRRMKMSSRDIT